LNWLGRDCWISSTQSEKDHPHFGDVAEIYNVIDARQYSHPIGHVTAGNTSISRRDKPRRESTSIRRGCLRLSAVRMLPILTMLFVELKRRFTRNARQQSGG